MPQHCPPRLESTVLTGHILGPYGTISGEERCFSSSINLKSKGEQQNNSLTALDLFLCLYNLRTAHVAEESRLQNILMIKMSMYQPSPLCKAPTHEPM